MSKISTGPLIDLGTMLRGELLERQMMPLLNSLATCILSSERHHNYVDGWEMKSCTLCLGKWLGSPTSGNSAWQTQSQAAVVIECRVKSAGH